MLSDPFALAYDWHKFTFPSLSERLQQNLVHYKNHILVVVILLIYLIFIFSLPVFVYDRNQQSVLEVNKTNYETCNTEHPLHNWTTGAGRDVVPLNVTKTYYFVSGNGFCYGGMKVAIHVEKLPPPPSSLPHKNGSPSLLLSTVRGQILVPALFAIAAVWNSFLLLW